MSPARARSIPVPRSLWLNKHMNLNQSIDRCTMKYCLFDKFQMNELVFCAHKLNMTPKSIVFVQCLREVEFNACETKQIVSYFVADQKKKVQFLVQQMERYTSFIQNVLIVNRALCAKYRITFFLFLNVVFIPILPILCCLVVVSFDGKKK